MDSCQDSHVGWKHTQDVIDYLRTEECISVGYLILEKEDYIILAPHLAPDFAEKNIGYVNGEMAIPTSQIVYSKDLR